MFEKHFPSVVTDSFNTLSFIYGPNLNKECIWEFFSSQFLGCIFICNLFPYIIQTAHIYLISNIIVIQSVTIEQNLRFLI